MSGLLPPRLLTVSYDRGFVLGVIVAALVPAFAIAHAIVGRYEDERRQLAREWNSRGERNAADNPLAAVIDFQTALSYGAAESTELKLAAALAAAKRPAEARAHLLTLWAEQPGNGEINLELARIAGSAGPLPEAVRYYHAAVDGAWEDDAPAARRTARLELARLLLASGERTRAQAELIALGADLPPDPQLITEVGRLLVQSGADNRALALFDRALALDASDADAARMAGAIEFRAGNDRQAVAYLNRAAAIRPLDAESRGLLDVSTRALALDPAAVKGARQRAQRIMDAILVARARHQRCASASPPPADSDRLAALGDRMARAAVLRRQALERDGDLADETLSLVFDIESVGGCGPDSVDDRALQRLAARRPAALR